MTGNTKVTSMQRSKRWCFTWNNYPSNYGQAIQDLQPFCAYYVYGRETAPTTGTEHIQGYFHFNTPMCFSKLKRLLPGVHFQKANGTETQNYRYCTKSGNFEEYGTRRTQGQRSDLELAVQDLVDNKQGIREVAAAHRTTYVRYSKGLLSLRNILVPVTPRDFRSNVYIMFGPTRTGKSASAADVFKQTACYYKNRSSWWHQYQQEPTVIIDDYYGWLPWDELLKICDRYPYKVETKGSYEEFTSRDIVITSNKSPTQWYKFEGYDPSPLLSDRINCTIETFTCELPIMTIYNKVDKDYSDALYDKIKTYINKS